MNVSFRWLQKLAPTIVGPPEAVAERLTSLAVTVDEMTWLGAGLDDIVIGRVASVARHPNADKLVICQVDAGSNGDVQVVTGAPSVVEGGFYPFIGVGGTLPGGLAIKRAKLRGEYSEGMLCSERELQMGRDQEGIMLLRGEFEPGMPLLQALDLDDHRLLIDVTANRPDLLGHMGVAREIAPGGQRDLVVPDFPGHKSIDMKLSRAGVEGETGGVRIRIDDTSGCSRFVGVVLRGVTVGPSPEWLARDLRAVGSQPINNVVDATNYVLYEMNQPIHAYDLPTITGKEIIVRRAKAGEKIRTLDGKDRELNSDVLVIGDAGGVNGLAGIMGGAASEVSESTTDLFIEAAYFDPRTVRSGARGLGMDTEASYRFQRGVDPTATATAMQRVVNLILATAGGSVESSGVDLQVDEAKPLSVSLRPGRATHLLGVDIGAAEIRGHLEPLGFGVKDARGSAMKVSVPGWRPDVTREVDLIEEVARRHGYDTFPDELAAFRLTLIPQEEYARVFSDLRSFFVSSGFLEARSMPLATANEGEIALLNPLSEVESHLRADLLGGLLRSVERNFAHGVRDVRLFELGTVFRDAGAPRPDERIRCAAVWTGARSPAHWSNRSVDFDVWDLKWLVGSIVEIAARGCEARPLDDGAAAFEDAYAVITADGQPIGFAGRIAARRIESPRWAGPLWGAELEILTTEARQLAYSELPIYPASERDLAIVVPQSVLAAEIRGVIRRVAPEFLEELNVFDVYEGENIPAGMRSVAWRLRFRAPDRTLTDEEIDGALGAIVRALEKELNVRVREA